MENIISIMGVSPAIAAGAAVAGAMLGDKTAKISDTALLTTATVGGIKIDEHARMVMRTAIPAVILSALLFLVLGWTGYTGGDPIVHVPDVARHCADLIGGDHPA